MIVKEHINFERGLDPKDAMETGLMTTMKNMGIHFYFEWGDGDGKIEKERFIKQINKMYNFVEKLILVGVDPKEMSISSSSTIRIKIVQVLNGNHVIHECISTEDAKMLIDACIALSVEPYPDEYHISDGEKLVYLHKHPWLDKLVQNREKYKSIK